MSISADVLRKLAALSLAPDQMAGVLSLLADVAADGERLVLADETRRAKDRARKHRGNSTEDDGNIRGKGAEIPAVVSPKEMPPAPPKEITLSTSLRSELVVKRASAPESGCRVEFSMTFWPAYPNHVGERRAIFAYIDARQRASLAEIMAGVERYRSSKPRDRQWMNPATFLEEDRWKDEPADPPESLKPAKPHDTISEPWLRSLRNGLGSIGGRPTLATGLSVNLDQRKRILSEIERLKSLTTCGARHNEEVAIELAKLFAAFPAQGQSDSPAELRMDAYFEALATVPSWAVAEARQRIVRGEAGLDFRFAPTPPQMASVARLVVKALREDLADLRRIAEAAGEKPDPTPAEKDRVSAGFESLKASLASAGIGEGVEP